MGVARGVLLDECLLCGEDDAGGGAHHLLPGAAALLRRLQYSKLRVGICYREGATSEKVTFLTNVATTYSFGCISWNPSCMSDIFKELLLAWSGAGGICFYATSRRDEELFHELCTQGWRIILKNGRVDLMEDKELLSIYKLDELLITLCHSNKSEKNDASVTIIGYVMKPSREEDFAKRGAFPMCPTENGLMFVPLNFELPLAYQIQLVDAVLHKATDEIIKIDPATSLDFPKGITFSKGMQELESYVQAHPDCCIIDPLSNIFPFLDRLQIQQILLGLEDISTETRCKIRAPHFLKIDNFQEPNLRERLAEAKLSFPNIVKPQVACGIPDAHNMALVFKGEDFKDLRVPLPAIIQEYVNHGSVVFKIYVLGEKVFHAIKKSMPNADVLLSSSEKDGCAPIIFDSLKSLPTATSKGGSEANMQSIDMELVTNAANWLRRQLGVTIFGFDIVIEEGTGDHVIVDLNYLPSFKEIPDSDAVPAFWDAIKNSYEYRKASPRST